MFHARKIPVFTFAALALAGTNASADPENAHAKSSSGVDVSWSTDGVAISATKDISNVIVMYCTGETEKFDDLDVGPETSFDGAIHSLIVKAGTTETLSVNYGGCPVDEPDGGEEQPR